MTEPQRANLGKTHPSSFKALIALSETAEQDAADAGLPPLLVELVKIRTSQINGCAYCLRLHTRSALEKGETTDRLAVLSAWRETRYFSAEEQAALTLAESMALMGSTHVDDESYAAAAAVLTPEQVSAVGWISTVMNAFNRVAVTSRYDVGPH